VNQEPASFDPGRFFIVFSLPKLSTIPVRFINLNAFKKRKDILVTWTVEHETDIEHYEIEKSFDGINFRQVHAVKNRGMGSTSNTYEWTDPTPAAGDHFYRIRSVSKAGNFEYSKTAKVTLRNSISGIVVFPNPVTGAKLNLQLQHMPAGRYQFKLVNSLGETISQTNYNHPGGSSRYIISTGTGFVKGTYLLEIIHPDKSNTVLKVIH
jgi:hypothetical protein